MTQELLASVLGVRREGVTEREDGRCGRSRQFGEPEEFRAELSLRHGRLRQRPRGAQGRLHPVRALVFHGPGDLRLEEVPRPEPQEEGDVLVLSPDSQFFKYMQQPGGAGR